MAGGTRQRLIRLSLVLAAIVAILAGPALAAQSPISVARGHAQIVAQGVISLPAEAAWRVVYRTIEPDKPVAFTGSGEFALVDQGALTLADESSTLAALGEGEARQLPADTELTATALDDRPAGFYELAVVPAAAASEAGSGLAIFAGAAFAGPDGERDLKLIRDILQPEEETSVAAVVPEAPVLILATLGSIEVTAGNAAPVELRAGQALAVDGEVTVRGTGLAPATFVAAVIGRNVLDNGRGTPVASPAGSPIPAGASVTVQVRACPIGMRPGEANPNLCPIESGAVDLRLVARDRTGQETDLGSAQASGDQGRWESLAPGDYILRAAGFSGRYDRFFVPGLAGLSGEAGAGYPAGPEGGYRIPISDPQANYRLDVFAFASSTRGGPGTPIVRTTAVAVRQEKTGEVKTRVFACPAVGLNSFAPAACAPATQPFQISLLPPTGGPALTLADATAGEDGAQVFRDLTPGTYVFQVPQLPAGTIAYFIAESSQVTLLPDATGYAVAVSAEAPVSFDLYTVGPEPVPTAPPTVAATQAPTVAAAETPAGVQIVDSDGDGLSDQDETEVYGTDPFNWDTDGDGVGDGDEIIAGSDPFTPNTAAIDTGDLDSDGLADVDEATYGTDPNNPDSDGDGWLDGNEVQLGTNPLDPASFPESP